MAACTWPWSATSFSCFVCYLYSPWVSSCRSTTSWGRWVSVHVSLVLPVLPVLIHFCMLVYMCNHKHTHTHQKHTCTRSHTHDHIHTITYTRSHTHMHTCSHEIHKDKQVCMIAAHTHLQMIDTQAHMYMIEISLSS